MNIKKIWPSLAALTIAICAAGPAAADDPTPDPNKGKSMKATPAEKQTAKANRKAEVADAKKKGELPAAGEGMAPTPGAKASGTSAMRSAERKEKRKEVAEAEKKGETLKAGEAAEAKKK